MPAEGYVGSAYCLKRGIGFNVWEQNESEFRYYRDLGSLKSLRKYFFYTIVNKQRNFTFTEKEFTEIEGAMEYVAKYISYSGYHILIKDGGGNIAKIIKF
jgi:hypothetical protein